MKLLKSRKRTKQRKESKQQREKVRQHKEPRQCEEIEYLLRENKRLHSKILDLKNSMEELQINSRSLTDLIHISWEGICTESVGFDEIQNAITSLYLLSEGITKQAEHIMTETSL